MCIRQQMAIVTHESLWSRLLGIALSILILVCFSLLLRFIMNGACWLVMKKIRTSSSLYAIMTPPQKYFAMGLKSYYF